VAALVLEAGGNEDEAIAALLHDAVEIRVGYLAIKFANFGDRVVAMSMAAPNLIPCLSPVAGA